MRCASCGHRLHGLGIRKWWKRNQESIVFSAVVFFILISAVVFLLFMKNYYEIEKSQSRLSVSPPAEIA